MSSISAALGASGPHRTIEHAGKVFTVGLLDQRTKAAFCEWVAAPHLATLRACADVLPAGELVRLIKEAADEAVGRKYGFYGSLVQDALRTTEGGIKLAALLLGCSEDEAITLLVERPTECRVEIELALAKSMPRARAGEQADPNERAPGAA